MSDLSSWIASLPAGWTAGCPVAVIEAAHAQYQSPGRFYHSWKHITACADTLRNFPCDSGRQVFLALLFHDAIYVPGNSDNEARSAELASSVLVRHTTLPAGEIAEIHRFIVATKDHRVDESERSRDLRATIDIDMSILGSPWEQYCEYAKGVRREYCPAVTTEARFVAGRSAFLAGVLESAGIFHTAEGIARWERWARENIARELRELNSEPIAGA